MPSRAPLLYPPAVIRCRACAQEAPDGSLFCPRCGVPFDPSSATPTRTVHVAGGGAASRARSLTSSSRGSSGGRFLPGTVVSERYRIFGLVGRGGMGEV